MEAYNQTLNSYIQTFNEKHHKRYLTKQEMYGDIIPVLRNGCGVIHNSNYGQKNFQLMKIGNVNVIYN
jgi:hypothetical protein